MRQPQATPGAALTMGEAARRAGYSRSHWYRMTTATEPPSPHFDPELAALIRHHNSGRPFVLDDELDALLRSRCSTVAPAQESAA